MSSTTSPRKRVRISSFDNQTQNATLSDLVVPIVMWHTVPIHPISAMALSPSKKHIVTGDVGGRLIIWDVVVTSSSSSENKTETLPVENNCQPTPRSFCVGHNAHITSIAFGIHHWGMEVFISLSAEGSIAVWSLDDGRCLGQRMNFFGADGLGPCLSVTNIYTFHDRHFAIVTGQSSHFEVVNLSTLETVWSSDLSNGDIWINDVTSIRNTNENEEHAVFSHTAALLLTNDCRMYKFQYLENNDKQNNEKSNNRKTLKQWTVHWPTNEERKVETLGKKTSENNNEHELKDVPHHFCTSPDGMKIAFFGKFNWGLLDVKWLNGNENNIVPVVMVNNDDLVTKRNSNYNVNEFDMPTWKTGTFLREDIILVWTMSGVGYLYKINRDLEASNRDKQNDQLVTLLNVLNDNEKIRNGDSSLNSICRQSHATKAFPSKFGSTGYTLGDAIYQGWACESSPSSMMDESNNNNNNNNDDDGSNNNVFEIFACNGSDQIKSWKIEDKVSRVEDVVVAAEMPSTIAQVSDAFFDDVKSNRCTAALVVHDDGINGLNGIPGVMIRAYNDGSIHFYTLPYDQNPLTVNCRVDHNDSLRTAVASSPRQSLRTSKKRTRCLTMTCPFWARQRSMKGRVQVTRLLICGCSDGTLRIWTFTIDIDAVKARTPPYVSAKLCFSYHGHRGHIIDVSAALPRNLLINNWPKEQTFHKNAGFQDKLFCSIGKDRGIVLYAVTVATREHLNVDVLHFFQGHPSPISAVQWRLNAGLLVAVCNNGVALVWGLQSGQMERRVSPQAIDIPYTRNSYIYKNKIYNSSSTRGIWKGTVDDLMSKLRNRKKYGNIGEDEKKTSSSKTSSNSESSSSNMNVNDNNNNNNNNRNKTASSSKMDPSNNMSPEYNNMQDSRPRVFSLTPVPGAPPNKKRQEEGDLIGPTLVTMENKNSNSSKSKKLSSNNKKGSAESPVQIVKVEGSNCLCSQGGASPDVILVSIAAVAKRASSNGNAKNSKAKRGADSCNNWHSDMNLAVVSYLLSWGLDANVDAMCLKELGLKAPDLSESVSYALRGAGSALTMSFPKKSSGLNRWRLSPEMSALHSLALVSLFMSLMSTQSRKGGLQQGFFSKLITHYGIIFPEKLKPLFIEPSLSTLAHYGLDTWEDGHVSARLLLQGTIERMAEHTRIAQASEWAARLHHAESIRQKEEEDKRAQKLAQEAYIARMNAEQLGLLGEEDRLPLPSVEEIGKKRLKDELADETQQQKQLEQKQNTMQQFEMEKDLATNSSDNNNNNNNNNSVAGSSLRERTVRKVVSSFNNLSLKMTGSGKDPNNLDKLLKLKSDPERDVMVLILSVIGVTFPQDIAPPTARLVASTLLYHLNYGNEIFAGLAAELIGKGFALWRPHIPRLAGLIRRLLTLALYAEFHGGTRSKNIDGSETQGVSVAAAAQRALLEIGAFQPMLFISTVGEEMLRPDMSDEYHRTSIMAMVSLVKKRPLSLARHLSTVVEAVIKSLDPSKPLLRKGCLQASTKALHELVKRFPVVAFHQRTQRFAVGTAGKVIIIYDLRTATKWRLLEGHKGMISALAFAPDGNSLASYSIEEKCVKTWQAGSTGWMGGILGLSAKCIKTIAVKKIDGPIVPQDALLKCRIQWMSPKQLKLRRENGKLSTIDI